MKKKPKPEEESAIQAPVPADLEDSSIPAEIEAEASIPIVGIGASAGGLEAFEQFFANLPADSKSGMAFVLVQHLDPNRKSILVDLVKRYTKMKVFEVTDGMAVEPNCAYIIPPNKDMALMHGHLQLLEPIAARGLRLPIDYFFRSLAQDQGEKAICVVLSGTGTDGTLGLKEIKGKGGLTMVQEPESAAYDGMPRSAINTGMVDFILPPVNMAAQLMTYLDQPYSGHVSRSTSPKNASEDYLRKIFFLLRNQTGHDFSQYKQNTIERRIERRMAVNQIEKLAQYVVYLQKNPLEIETLFRELLIGVTSFFRDPEAFEALVNLALIPLIRERSQELPLRMWVTGCSTGEEAYSIAILAQECLDNIKKHVKIQIFATDIDAEAIERARAGVYPNSIVADVSPERLARFFVQEENSYRVRKSIRDLVVFATQSVIADPPFSKLDLVSCRNLLIYLDASLQQKVLPTFHYALNQDGFLLLGTSESIGEFADLFKMIDRKQKIFQRKGGPNRFQAPLSFSTPRLPVELQAIALPPRAESPDQGLSMRELAEKTLLAQHTPASVIVNEKGEVLYIHGRTGKYLEPSEGETSNNILRMARQGLRLGLTTALRKAIAQRVLIEMPALKVKTNGDTAIVNLLVEPINQPAGMRGLYLVVLHDITPAEAHQPLEAAGTSKPQVSDKEQRIVELELELRTKEEYLQAIIEEMETSNEEMKSTNEEMQSANEELQSTNEELETSKEELQSLNEELNTVNAELQQNIGQLNQTNNDMNNLLAGTGVGTIFLNNQLIIQRFTPAAAQLINLIRSDIGRPVNHIVPNLKYERLVEDVQDVLDSLIPKTVEVQATDARWYLMRILPYRTLENVIDGAVITFVDISEQKATQQQLKKLSQEAETARTLAESIVDSVNDALVILDGNLRVISASRAFYRNFELTPKKCVGQLLYDLADHAWDIPALRQLLEEILPEESSFTDFLVEHEFAALGKRSLHLNALELMQDDDKNRRILLAIKDAIK